MARPIRTASFAVCGLVAGVLGTGAVPAAAGTSSCTAAVVPIGQVQGSGSTSPLAGQAVTVRGTVVGAYQGPAPALRGVYVEDGGDGDTATSDGVFVFTGNGTGLRDGEVVQVTGTVAEFQGQTQITATGVEDCATTGTVTPVDVTLPRAGAGDLERYEGMLVRVRQTLTVTETYQLGRFGQVVVSAGGRLRQPTALYRPGDPRAAALQRANDLDRLIVDDATNAQNPDPIVFGRDGAPLSAANTLRGGDALTDPVGVLTYTWAGNAASGNAFRLRPVGALGGTAVFRAANPRPQGPPRVGGTIRVASANLLNFFTRTSGCTLGVGGAPTDCRGARSAAEYRRQLAKEVAALTSLHADVLAVIELENDGYGPDSSLAALVGALNAAQGAGTWASVDVDAATGTGNAAGTDAIRSALLYRPARVRPLPGLTATDRALDAAGARLFERNPVAQTFGTPGGGRLTVVANHFKSKGSCPVAGDPAYESDRDRGDGQGCWNDRRTRQARELARWLREEVVPAARDDRVLLVGDLNSYAREDPIVTLQQAGYVDLTRRYGGPLAYSYVFDGQWGSLDYALASACLARQARGAADVHINADEPPVLDYTTAFKSPAQLVSLYAPDRYRTSDHDPVVSGFSLTRRR